MKSEVESPKQKKHKNKRVNRKVLFITLCIISIVTLAGYFYIKTNPKFISIITKQPTTEHYKAGKGGDTQKVVDYHKQAVDAWKAGDKTKAKDFAKKGLEENDKLTVKQQSEVPDQISIVFDMYDITQGSYRVE